MVNAFCTNDEDMKINTVRWKQQFAQIKSPNIAIWAFVYVVRTLWQ